FTFHSVFKGRKVFHYRAGYFVAYTFNVVGEFNINYGCHYIIGKALIQIKGSFDDSDFGLASGVEKF
ncbi:MAG: hypothetical protein MI747_15085, partial [Desulfobacterales bacterium]|nr:hypothetical protein [Desulfobacterales bacterium]